MGVCTFLEIQGEKFKKSAKIFRPRQGFWRSAEHSAERAFKKAHESPCASSYFEKFSPAIYYVKENDDEKRNF